MMAPTKAQDESTKIALINNNIGYIQKDISDIKGTLKELSGVFATSVALREVAVETERRFSELENKSISADQFEPVKKIV